MQMVGQRVSGPSASGYAEACLRALFVVTVIAGGGLFWLAPHPPMGDLPQHAAQIATLHDLLLGRSPWRRLLRINCFTPYLLPYALATALSFVMPVAAAIKTLLTLSFYGFVVGYRAVRTRLGADARLDWLCIPGYFGFAYELGLFSYLVAVPLGMALVLTALGYAQSPSARGGWRLLVAGVALFFAHGLVFAFVSAISGGFLLARQARDWRLIVRSSWPFVLLGALCGAYALTHRDIDAVPLFPFSVLWDASPWSRILWAIVCPWGRTANDWIVPATLATLAAPLCMGLRWRLNRMTAVPIVLLGVVWFCVPRFALNTDLLFQRFALFIFPFYALAFPSRSAPVHRHGSARRRVAHALLAVGCMTFISAKGLQAVHFASETADFDTLSASVEPAQRALQIGFDESSPATQNHTVYAYYALWYQAERRGFVDFNFAWYPPQVVRFRTQQLPAVKPSDAGPGLLSETFNWQRHHGWIYRYFFVRHTTPVPEQFFANPDCRVVLLRTVGTWSVYERQACTPR
jgi:hypothetical protein